MYVSISYVGIGMYVCSLEISETARTIFSLATRIGRESQHGFVSDISTTAS